MTEEAPLPVSVKIVAASGASLVSALVVNPFDVIKVSCSAATYGSAIKVARCTF